MFDIENTDAENFRILWNLWITLHCVSVYLLVCLLSVL